MAKETERKFLVRKEILIPLLSKDDFEKKIISQYYLVASKGAAVRLRMELSSSVKVFLTVKAGGDGMTSDEFEFPLQDGPREYFDNLGSRKGIEIKKTRHLVPHGGRTFEVDVFHDDLEGLVVAELEAEDAAEVTDLPEWLGREVTFERGYKNAVLAVEGIPDEFFGNTVTDFFTSLLEDIASTETGETTPEPSSKARAKRKKQRRRAA